MITIGIPVYNEDKFFRQTLESVIANYDYIQRVIITDNCSTDNTEKIAQEFVNKYSKIEYLKQAQKVHVVLNWKTSLNLTETKYFMWLGGHDILSNNYVKEMLNELEMEKDVVAACPNIYHFTNNITDKTATVKTKDYIDWKSDDIKRRAIFVARNWKTCYMCNQIYHTNKIRIIYDNLARNLDFVNWDHILAMHLSLLGEICLVNNASYYYRNNRKIETYEESIERRLENAASNSEISDVNPQKYILNEFIRLAKEYIPDQDISLLEKEIIIGCRKNFGAELSDNVWKTRRFLSGIKRRVTKLIEITR